jgi:hypothetical protein
VPAGEVAGCDQADDGVTGRLGCPSVATVAGAEVDVAEQDGVGHQDGEPMEKGPALAWVWTADLAWPVRDRPRRRGVVTPMATR